MTLRIERILRGGKGSLIHNEKGNEQVLTFLEDESRQIMLAPSTEAVTATYFGIDSSDGDEVHLFSKDDRIYLCYVHPEDPDCRETRSVLHQPWTKTSKITKPEPTYKLHTF